MVILNRPNVATQVTNGSDSVSHLGSFTFAATIRSREKHAYTPALNPANLRAQKTSYQPGHTPSGSLSYGAQAPPVYASAPDYTAGKDGYA